MVRLNYYTIRSDREILKERYAEPQPWVVPECVADLDVLDLLRIEDNAAGVAEEILDHLTGGVAGWYS